MAGSLDAHATVQMQNGPKLVVDVDGDYRCLDFDLDLLSLPSRALEIGDAVECEVERIGVLRNTVAAA